MTAPARNPESRADMIFSLVERMDHMSERLTRKIDRLDRRLTVLEQRRRFP